MGNEQPKEQKVVRREIDKSKLEILLKQIYFTAQLQKDRKRGVQMTKEKELLALIREPTNKRSRENEYQKASSIVNDVKSVKAHEYIMRYSDILKDNVLVIQQSKGDPNKIVDLLPYAESIIWGCQKCNLDCGQAFVNFIGETFGLQVQGAMLAGTKVTDDIKNCFDTLIATENQVKRYLVDFCRQKGIDLAVLNEIGHNISPEALNDEPPKHNQGQQTSFHPNDGFNQGQGGFPGGQQGFPGGQQGFPGGQQGFPGGQQGGFQQGPGGYQGGYNPNQGGFQQGPGGYQGGYQQGPGGYGQGQQGGNQGFNPNQGGYNQGGNQGGFQPQGPGGYGQSQQGGFPQNQGGYGQSQQGGNQGFNPQGGYSQQGGNQGSFNPNQGPNNYSQQGSNQGFQAPNNFSQQTQGTQNFNVQPQFQQPQNTNLQSFNTSTNPNQFYVPQSQPQNQAPSVQPQNPSNNVSQQPSNDFGGAYPTFQKFTDNNAGPKPSSDPLDELDLRLKNIKNGL